MKEEHSHGKPITGIIRDFIIVVVVVAFLCLIDSHLAAFVGAISFSMLLIRRVILYYNPGFIKGHHIYYQERELTVSKEVDIFDLGKVSSFQYLYNYSEVIAGILIPPRIFIIRFCGILSLKEWEFDILKGVLHRLQSRKIIVILSDIEENVMDQVEWYLIEKEVGVGNIFFNISDALRQARKALIRVKITIA